jgi:DNA-binding response OmpR family regulator
MVAAMGLGNPRILVVEDESALRKLVLRRMAQHHVEAIEAATSASGFMLAVAEKPDVILLDLQLPDGPGIDLLARLKGDSRTADIPVVAWSGNDSKESEALVREAGAAAYFEKSDLRALTRQILSMLSR